ncbi:GNAT family N-acetyltransferase [Clostridium paraputrificum]|uniref:GNAT family N-acetyltransferase n=1 Tax=Clostridium paraputrificum TaxID=29363 RepID=UPI003D331B52
MNFIVTKEKQEEFSEVEKVVEEAFKEAEFTDHNEHNLVKKLRNSSAFISDLSLVAKIDNKIIGHILYTELNIMEGDKRRKALALAPLAVLPEFQGKAVGSKLVRESLEKAKELGYGGVIVLGHENYYPKFGFIPAWKYGIKAPFDVPEDAFMALELKKDYFKNVNGTVEYSKEFFE